MTRMVQREKRLVGRRTRTFLGMWQVSSCTPSRQPPAGSRPAANSHWHPACRARAGPPRFPASRGPRPANLGPRPAASDSESRVIRVVGCRGAAAMARCGSLGAHSGRCLPSGKAPRHDSLPTIFYFLILCCYGSRIRVVTALLELGWTRAPTALLSTPSSPFTLHRPPAR
jgi:hypothetical protein